MRSYLLFRGSILDLFRIARPIIGRLADPASMPVSHTRVEMVCGGANASVDSDLSGYFRLDVDTLQPVRNPGQWSISKNTLLAPRSDVVRFEKFGGLRARSNLNAPKRS